MKIISIAYLILLCPTLAMNLVEKEDDSFTQLYHDRIREGERRVRELQQESNTTLHGKNDIIISVNKQIYEKRLRLPTPAAFLEELDNLLKLLLHPEELLNVEQRRALTGFPALEPLQPISNVIDLLGKFIKKWQSLTAHAEVLQLAVNQSIWYHTEWTNFALEMTNKLKQKTILCEDLLKIYQWMSYFHAQEAHLATSCTNLLLTLKATALIPEDLGYLDFMFQDLTSFFQVRGSVLWEIIRYSDIITDSEKTRNLTKNYEEIPSDFFLHRTNLLKIILEETNPLHQISISVPIRQDHPSLKEHPIYSLPMPVSPQKKTSFLLSYKTHSSPNIRQVHSAPQTRSGSPVPLRVKPKIPTGNFLKRLEEAFVQPDEWDMDIIAFKEKVLLLIHAKFIAAPLCQLVNYYGDFKLSYLRNHTIAYDILSPKAHLDIPGQPLVRIRQTLARKVSSLKSHGYLCFNQLDCDEETTPSFSGHIGNLIFKKRRELYPSQTRQHFFQFNFENIFGIPSNPILVGACDHVSFYAPRENKQQLTLTSCSEKYLENPHAWNENQKRDFITIHRKRKGEIFLHLLNQIADGQGTLTGLLDPNSIGLRILFGLLTQEDASPQNFELIKNVRKFTIERMESDPFLQPSFMLREDKNHHFIGHNIFYLLPFMDEKIPEEVKGSFISNNIFLGLSTVLTQLAKNQKEFDQFIQKYQLTEDDGLKSELELQTKLSIADVLGLTLTARKETIHELIRNFTIMKQCLNIPGITYRQILQELRPLEFHCYQQIIENAKKKTQTAPIFFTKVIPFHIEQLRNLYENMIQLGEIPLDPVEDYDHFEQASNLYCKKIAEYLEKIDKLNDKRALANSTIENLKSAQITNEATILELQEQLRLLINNTAPEISSFPMTINNLTKIDVYIEIKGPEDAGSDSLVGSTAIDNTVKIEELQKRLEEEIEKKKQNELKLALILKQLEDIYLSSNEIYIRLSPQHLFQELQDHVSRKAQAFLETKYRWAEENGIFQASVVLKAWESMFDSEKPLIYETLIKSNSLPDWSGVPMLTQNQFATVYAHLIESNHPIENMVQDLLNHPDLSSPPPPMALQILDRLLPLTSHSNVHPQNWQRILQIARKEFLGMPPHVQSFFYSLGLQPNEEANVLQNAQLQRFEDYGRRTKMVTSGQFQQQLTPEQFATHLFHQLWAGSLELDQEKDQLFFNGLVKFFSLPLCISQISAGFAINPESKGGIFDLRYRVGDHYPLVKSPDWIKLFESSYLLPEKMRLNFLSHSLPLLHLQWLTALKESYPNIQFHPWYMKTLINKSTLLQDFLRTRLSFTFNEIMSIVWPEFYFVTEQALNNHNNDVDLTLKSQTNETHKLTPIENGASLDYHKNGKNMLTLLREWDEEHMRCVVTPPLSLDEAATEWLADLNPADYGPVILAHILSIATHFAIDPKKINPALWNNPKILTDLVNINAPLKCVQLVAALRTGLPFIDITLKQSKSFYQISGLQGNVELICDLIPLFPDITSLSLENNQLRSLKPLISSLKMLPSLIGLSLKDNPIHNPVLFIELPQLTALNIENTCIPARDLEDLKKLIAREKREKVENIKWFDRMQSFSGGPSGVIETREHSTFLETSPATFLSHIRSYFDENDDLSDYTDKIICILERLGEGLWLDTLVLERHKLNIPCDILFGMLQEFQPRRIVNELLFAISHNLPHGTNPDTLSFVDNIPSMEANCLMRLDVSKVYVNPQFLPSLCLFVNLSHLSLIDIGLTNLDDLPILRQLKVLNLRNNKIKTLAGLHTNAHDIKFPNINILNLANNKIVTNIGISFLRELLKLTYLDLNSNELSEIPSLGNLENLQYLDLRENKITSIKNSHVNQGDYFYAPQRK